MSPQMRPYVYGQRRTRRMNSRRRARRRTKMIITYICIIVVFMLIILGNTIYNDYQRYKIANERIETCTTDLAELSQKTNLSIIREHQLIMQLRKDIYEWGISQPDEAIVILYQRVVPSEAELSNDRDAGLAILKALMTQHPEMKGDVTIVQTLYDLETAQAKVQLNVNNYNETIDSYNYWVTEHNDSSICFICPWKVIPPNIYPKMQLQ